MKKIILTTILFLTTLFSFGQYFVIGEMDSENQADSMKFLDLWMNGIKDVVGEDLNMNIFQKELSNTHFFVPFVISFRKGARISAIIALVIAGLYWLFALSLISSGITN